MSFTNLVKVKIEEKSMLVATAGGHLIELLSAVENIEFANCTLVTTNSEGAPESTAWDIVTIVDSNARTLWKALTSFRQSFHVVTNCKPRIVISTGASIGVFIIFWARVFQGAKCFWIDSVANTRSLSLSGKIARVMCDKVYVQSSTVANKSKDLTFLGSVF